MLFNVKLDLLLGRTLESLRIQYRISKKQGSKNTKPTKPSTLTSMVGIPPAVCCCVGDAVGATTSTVGDLVRSNAFAVGVVGMDVGRRGAYVGLLELGHKVGARVEGDHVGGKMVGSVEGDWLA